jgi:signal transduction histidine kinase
VDEVDERERAHLIEHLSRLDFQTVRMARLIEGFVDLALAQEGGDLPLRLQPADLRRLVAGAVEDRERADEQHIFRIEDTGGEVAGRWDSMRLERVMDNLLSNACKYSPEGTEVLVTLAREEAPGTAWATLRVKDHGIGIPAADLPHIFERFHRAGNVRGRIEGTGVGLFGARHIVEQHQGTLSVESHEGLGTTVTIRLPLAES